MGNEQRLRRKRLERTSSLDDLRSEKKMGREDSDANLLHAYEDLRRYISHLTKHRGHGCGWNVRCGRDPEWMSCETDNKRIPSFTNTSIGKQNEAMNKMRHGLEGNGEWWTNPDSHQSCRLFDALRGNAVMPHGHVPPFGHSALTSEMFGTCDLMGNQWREGKDEAMSGILASMEMMSDTQARPWPYGMQMVPVTSTVCNHFSAGKHPGVTRESESPTKIKMESGLDEELTLPKHGRKGSYESSTTSVDTNATGSCFPCSSPLPGHFCPERMLNPWIHGISYMDGRGNPMMVTDWNGAVGCQGPPMGVMHGLPCQHDPFQIFAFGQGYHTVTTQSPEKIDLIRQRSPLENAQSHRGHQAMPRTSRKKTTQKEAEDNANEITRRKSGQKNKRGKKMREGTASNYREANSSSRSPASVSPGGSSNRSTLTQREATVRGNPRHESSGRTTFADIVHARLVRTGTLKLAVGHDPSVTVVVKPEGSIMYKGVEHNSISSFALAVIRERNPDRRSCDGWKDVKYEGQRLELLRDRYQIDQSTPRCT